MKCYFPNIANKRIYLCLPTCRLWFYVDSFTGKSTYYNDTYDAISGKFYISSPIMTLRTPNHPPVKSSYIYIYIYIYQVSHLILTEVSNYSSEFGKIRTYCLIIIINSQTQTMLHLKKNFSSLKVRVKNSVSNVKTWSH